MKDLGELQSFLGIDRSEIRLTQHNYLRRLLQRFKMEECNLTKTPVETTPFSNSEEILQTSKPYRELVGCLMYVMLTTHSDLSFAVNYYSRYQHDQTEARSKGLKRILRYIKGTLNMSLIYKKGISDGLSCFVDADYGSESDRKLTSGFLIKVFGKMILWAMKRQTIALSSTEAEYVALATASSEIIRIKNLLNDLGVIWTSIRQKFTKTINHVYICLLAGSIND